MSQQLCLGHRLGTRDLSPFSVGRDILFCDLLQCQEGEEGVDGKVRSPDLGTTGDGCLPVLSVAHGPDKRVVSDQYIIGT